MNNNPSSYTPSYSGLPPRTSFPSASWSLNQASTPTARIEPYVPKMDFDYKQKNRGMYQSTMNLTGHSESVPSLSSFARRVNEVPLNKDKGDSDKYGVFNHDDKSTVFLSKQADHGVRDHRMASSAIFPDSHSNDEQFNRFPAFNLTPNQTFQARQPQQPNFVPNPNETAKQKREREIAAIKKQLQSLNKKMLNKPIPTIASTAQDLRPQRASGVSQSLIFEPSSTPSYNASSSNQFGVTGLAENKQMGPNSTAKQEIYPSNKYNEITKQAYSPYGQPVSSNQPIGMKTYEPEKELNNRFTPSRSYETSQPDEKYGTSNAYGNVNVYAKPQPESIATRPRFVSQNSKFDVFPAPSTDKNQFNFSKPAETTEQTAFKKKKFYETEAEEKKPLPGKKIDEAKDLKITNYPDSSTSTSASEQRKFKVRKIESVNYIDESNPLPEVRKFKYSDFIIGKKMGKGQFGEVLLVRHKLTGWLCGLKVMEKKEIRDQDYVAQIARELSIQFYLSHRNIAQLYGYFEDESKFYLLIEFCTGGQLLEKLRKEKRMQQADVSKIIRQTCQGTDYIHKEQIIHRDLKPENILFNFGVVKISDFGWAVYRGFGMRKTASGSPLYYPPEIVKGEEYDDKIDVWNIGMMTYECLLGKIPFRVYSQLDLGKIVSDEITFPSYVDVSDEAKDFILKTMKKKGEQRMEIRQMLRHPFLSKTQDAPLSEKILDQFRRVLE